MTGFKVKNVRSSGRLKVTSSLIPEMRCENPKVDLTNKVMGNHSLSDVDNRSAHYCDQPDRIFDMHVRLDI